MRNFHIVKPNEVIGEALRNKIDNLCKPVGSLGVLETLAIQIGSVQQTLNPSLKKPQHLLFAADHGIQAEGVSCSPKEVTWQQCLNFMRGGAAVNFFCRQHGVKLNVIDAGVDYDFPTDSGIIDKKVRYGSGNYLYEPAMSEEEFEMCIETGAELVRKCFAEGSNLISIGEMGIGNTSSSSLWMHFFTGCSIEDCVGAGAGLDQAGISKKVNILKQSLQNFKGDYSPLEMMRYFGGLEMVMAVGAMLQAAELKMLVMVDGFIMSNCMLAASKLYPDVLAYAIFGHCGHEAGHRRVLEAMQAKALLHLDFRLGEGTGALCALPLVDSAIRMVDEMLPLEALGKL